MAPVMPNCQLHAMTVHATETTVPTAPTNRAVVSNLILEYILCNASVARGFAPYFAVLIGKVRAAAVLMRCALSRAFCAQHLCAAGRSSLQIAGSVALHGWSCRTAYGVAGCEDLLFRNHMAC